MFFVIFASRVILIDYPNATRSSGYHLREWFTGGGRSFHPATADGNIIVYYLTPSPQPPILPDAISAVNKHQVKAAEEGKLFHVAIHFPDVPGGFELVAGDGEGPVPVVTEGFGVAVRPIRSTFVFRNDC